ncbi:hypothetical protein INR49_002400 [Caranx melampygus]|nr:hypothetical protein INR49_002400 [Caranx melampygus]
MMGGDQSRETKAEGTEDRREKQQQSAAADSKQSEDTGAELPQCRMGNKKVDNMCFMISCTNWY